MRLVVDADVLGAAGETDGACSRSCRGTLETISDRRHSVHYDSLLEEEWKQHNSHIARLWQLQMRQRGLLVFRARKPDLGLKRAVTRELTDRSAHKSALKDLHLVALALQADKAILSRDGTARGLFVKIGEGERRLRTLLWIDPTEYPDESLVWLRNEAEPLAEWRLVASEAAG